MSEAEAMIEVKDATGNIMISDNGVYVLKNGLYSYFVYKEGFHVLEDTFIVADNSLQITLNLEPLNAEIATMEATGREGEHEIDGVEYTFVEFEMLDEYGGRISLADGDVKYIRSNGRLLTPNTDATLWFNKEKESGTFEYVVETTGGIIYRAILEWVKP